MSIDYKNIPIPELFTRLSEKLSLLKEHTYWTTLDHKIFKSEVYKLYLDIMYIGSGFMHRNDYDDDNPFVCIFRDTYHDFSRTLIRIYDIKDVEQTEDFKQFFLVMLQDYLKIIQLFIEGKTDPTLYKMRIPYKDGEGTYTFTTYMPMYHEKWVNSDGYTFYSKYKWYAVIYYPAKDKVKLFKDHKAKIKACKKNMNKNKRVASLLIDFNYACIKDINEKTCFKYYLY